MGKLTSALLAAMAVLSLAACDDPAKPPQTFKVGEIVVVTRNAGCCAFRSRVVGIEKNYDGSTTYVLDEGSAGLVSESPYDMAKTH